MPLHRFAGKRILGSERYCQTPPLATLAGKMTRDNHEQSHHTHRHRRAFVGMLMLAWCRWDNATPDQMHQEQNPPVSAVPKAPLLPGHWCHKIYFPISHHCFGLTGPVMGISQQHRWFQITRLEARHCVFNPMAIMHRHLVDLNMGDQIGGEAPAVSFPSPSAPSSLQVSTICAIYP